jgi:hypothetical protein
VAWWWVSVISTGAFLSCFPLPAGLTKRTGACAEDICANAVRTCYGPLHTQGGLLYLVEGQLVLKRVSAFSS